MIVPEAIPLRYPFHSCILLICFASCLTGYIVNVPSPSNKDSRERHTDSNESNEGGSSVCVSPNSKAAVMPLLRSHRLARQQNYVVRVSIIWRNSQQSWTHDSVSHDMIAVSPSNTAMSIHGTAEGKAATNPISPSSRLKAPAGIPHARDGRIRPESQYSLH